MPAKPKPKPKKRRGPRPKDPKDVKKYALRAWVTEAQRNRIKLLAVNQGLSVSSLLVHSTLNPHSA